MSQVINELEIIVSCSDMSEWENIVKHLPLAQKPVLVFLREILLKDWKFLIIGKVIGRVIGRAEKEKNEEAVIIGLREGKALR